ncbi:hypothetical protein ACOMHN_006180 [Nucella lapillus]
MPSPKLANGRDRQAPYTVHSDDMYRPVTYEHRTHDNPAFECDSPLEFSPIDNGHGSYQAKHVTPGVITKQPTEQRRRLCIVIIVTVVILVLLVVIVLAVTLTAGKDNLSGGDTTTTPTRNTSRIADLRGSFRLKSATYVADMADVNSDVFKKTASKYEAIINRIYKSSKLSAAVMYSVVTQLRSGSVVVFFDLFLEDKFSDLSPEACREAFEEGMGYLLANDNDLFGDLSDISLTTLQIERAPKTTASPPTVTTTPSRPQPGQFPDLVESCGVAGRESGRRIVGGSAVQEGRYPWMVIVRTDGEAHCGGSIIDRYHVLGAAHCFGSSFYPGFGEGLTIMAGEVTLKNASTSPTAQIIKVARLYSHKDYNQVRAGTLDSNLNDICVLRLETPLTFNQYVSPICLPQPSDPLPQSCTVAGWGTVTASGKGFNPEMLAVDMWAYTSQACKNTFGESFADNAKESISTYLTDGVMCAANRTFGGADACFGDSGGPLFCEVASPAPARYKQYGVVSWGDGCGVAGSPGFYAYVPFFRPWLHRVALPIINFTLAIAQDSVCLNMQKCAAHMKNATLSPNTLSACQRLTNIVNCSMATPWSIECGNSDRDITEKEARKYAQFLNMEFERTVLDLTNCQLPP